MALFKAAIFSCGDPRIRKPLLRHLAEKYLIAETEVFQLTKPGGCLNFVEPPSPHQAIMTSVIVDVQILVELGVPLLFVAGHTDCAAYALRFASSNKEDEYLLHTMHIRETTTVLASRFPELELRELLVDIHSVREVRVHETALPKTVRYHQVNAG